MLFTLAGCSWFADEPEPDFDFGVECPDSQPQSQDLRWARGQGPRQALSADAAHVVVGYREAGAPTAPTVSEAAAEVREAHGLVHVRTVMDHVELVGAEADDVGGLLADLEADPRVRYAHLDRPLRPLENQLPNDPELARQRHLTEFGVPDAWAHHAPAGSEEVVVAVLDVGFNVDHPDLADVFVAGYDFGCDDASVGLNPNDPDHHGNHVAGIVAAATDNGVGGAGVADDNVRIVPVKVSYEIRDEQTSTSDYEMTVSTLAEAIVWASAERALSEGPDNPHPADVINISLGLDRPSEEVPAIADAVAQANDNGAIVVAASGNVGETEDAGRGVFSPANAPGVIAVGSVGANRDRDGFSVYTEGDPEGVDFVGPGGAGLCGPDQTSGVFSAVYATQDRQAGYDCLQGTSMASPYVAGAIALLQSQNGVAMTQAQVEQALIEAAFDDEGAMPRDEYGHGLVCIDAALGADTRCGDAIP